MGLPPAIVPSAHSPGPTSALGGLTRPQYGHGCENEDWHCHGLPSGGRLAWLARGEGVLETLHGLLELVFAQLEERYEFNKRFKTSPEEIFDKLFGHLGPAESVHQGVDR